MDFKGEDSEESVNKRRGGCGAMLPKLSIEGMKMIAEFKSPKKKSDDPDSLPEPAERKQQLSAERVYILQILLALFFSSSPSHLIIFQFICIHNFLTVTEILLKEAIQHLHVGNSITRKRKR